MSFLDNRERQFNWLAAPVASSLRVLPGCVQCGRSLDDGDDAKARLSGKCLNCRDTASEDNEFCDEQEF